MVPEGSNELHMTDFVLTKTEPEVNRELTDTPLENIMIHYLGLDHTLCCFGI